MTTAVPTKTRGYAVSAAKATFEPFEFQERPLEANDIAIDIQFCGVCHSDVHQVRDEWGGASFPMVPGHEIIGVVRQAGANVKKFKVGDRAGVGCMVDSCRECENCKAGEEQFCQKGCVFTYNSKDYAGRPTYGGYSKSIIVDENFALTIPENLDSAAAAPLLCAGVTTFSPLHHWKVGPGQKVGIVGLGGLGHMALKFAHAMGAQVVQFTTSDAKREDAKRLGADIVVSSKDEKAMSDHADSFDFILDTVSAPHDLTQYLQMLRRNGVMTLCGVPEKAAEIPAFELIHRRLSLAGSLIGGIKETQEMLDFCGQHNITADIEKIAISDIDKSFDRVVKSDVKYRFVIDNSTI